MIKKSRCPLAYLAYLKNHMSKFHQIFWTCYLWPWLGSPRTALRYVLPVLCMTSYFHVTEWMDRIRHNAYISDCILHENMMSFTKPELHNVLYCPQRKTEPPPQVTWRKFPEGADRQTHRHADWSQYLTPLVRGGGQCNEPWRPGQTVMFLSDCPVSTIHYLLF